MKPAEFAEVVVIPTVRDYLAHPLDLRRMYVACIVTDHITEHVAHSARKSKEAIREQMHAACGAPFGIVRGIAVARKHPDSGSAKRFRAGDEQVAPAFGFAEAQVFVNAQPTIGGFGVGSFGAPRLYVLEGGKRYIIDTCVPIVLVGFVSAYPEELGAVDVSSFDPSSAPETLP